ncbi:hypothetical protein Mgra_00006523 [Meloidogyne graminicola]|uniref:Uncharacterized protein n=1 Tax=Meloidogyne graminicola TaxID=189291 RepID=A0A8S9ZL49_9BILA|nr:hypothetical protein Mgra_00006523 [Meloidogyne graminicola]
MMLSNVKYQMEMKSKNGEQKCLLITNRADEDEQYSIMQPINTSTNNTSSLLLEKNSQKNGQRKKSISSNGKIGVRKKISEFFGKYSRKKRMPRPGIEPGTFRSSANSLKIAKAAKGQILC